MWWTAYNDLLASAQIRVDTSTITGGFGGTQEQDATTLAPYQNVGTISYALRWRHFSANSYQGDDGFGNTYDYFAVRITYECNSSGLEIQADIADSTYTLEDAETTILASSDMPEGAGYVSGCAYTMVCESWNDSDQSWDTITPDDGTQPILNCDTTNGITLEVADGDSFYDSYRPDVEVAYRVVFTDTYSLLTDGTE